ncbi:MAG: FHA domain-containing protein [Solirubrobacterales bacterium]|nr:FHA domain-containing protein [Solirubrobacterales bacterium]
MSLALRCTEGALVGELIEVDGELVLGRGRPGAASLGEDSRLSRRHARLRAQDGRLLVEDLGSTNGTFVNDQRLSAPRELAIGDRIRCGRTLLEVCRGRDGGETTQATPRLEIVAGALAGQTIPLGAQLAIGRGYGEPGALGGDRRLSRRHACIAQAADGIHYVHDTGSTNGTTLNGQRLRGPQVLSDGDEIAVGSTRMIVHGLPYRSRVEEELTAASAGGGGPPAGGAGTPAGGGGTPAGGGGTPAGGAGTPSLAAAEAARATRVRGAPATVAAPAAPAGSGAPGVVGAPPAAGAVFVPQGAAPTRLGSRRLVAVFAAVFALSAVVGIVAVLALSPRGSRACPNGFVCEKPLTAPPLVAARTFQGALGWHLEYDPSSFTVISSSVAGNRLTIGLSPEQNRRVGLAGDAEVIQISTRAYPAGQESANAAMTAMAASLSGPLLGAARAPSADQIFGVPVVGLRPGVGEVLEGNQRTPQGPGSLLKVVALAATAGRVTIATGVVYVVQQGSGGGGGPDQPLDAFGDQIIGTIRFPSDGQA